VEADGLTKAPLDAISHDGLADRARQGEADVRTHGFGLADAKRREERSSDTDPMVVDPSKILRSEDADTFRKAWD